MKLDRNNQLLAVVLVVQLVLLAVFGLTGRPAPAETNRGALIPDYKTEAVTALTITEPGETPLKIERGEGDTWILPDADSFPVLADRVTQFLGVLEKLETRRLVAQNASSHKRLKVAADDYERLVEVQMGETTHRLYLGASAGGSTSYTRLDDAGSVYLNDGLSIWQISASESSWVNTAYFTVAQNDVVSYTLTNPSGTFAFTRSGELWTLPDLAAGEALDQTKVSPLVGSAVAIYLNKPLGRELKPEYGMDKPSVTITLHTRREIVPTPGPTETPSALDIPLPITPGTPAAQIEEADYTILIGAALENGDYVVKASNADYYVAMSGAAVKTLLDVTRESLLLPPPTPTMIPTPTATPLVEPTAAPTVQPTVQPTEAATEVPTQEPTAAATAGN